MPARSTPAPSGTGAPPVRATRRRGNRREVILAAAARLFSENGYPATGIDDIGEAAGVTGPAVYRHFDNKHAVLSAVIVDAIERILAGVATIVDEVTDPEAVLEALAGNVVAEILADPAAWTVLVLEQRHLEPASARALERAHRLHIQEWVHALSQLRPELTEDQMRTMVHCALGLTVAAAGRHRSGLSDERITELLVERMVQVLLDAGSSGSGGVRAGP